MTISCTADANSGDRDRKSTRLNSSHLGISYAVFCLKKKKKDTRLPTLTGHKTNMSNTEGMTLRQAFLLVVFGYFLISPVFFIEFFVIPDFFFNDTATTEIYTLSLHDALPI